jgi:DNA-binding transcriptional MerR regulator
MQDLIKIKDVSSKYDITARTLRYYEDMGLINSNRTDDYAYRMYDDNAVKRIEQILILRKLNISIKDIQQIFNAPGSEVVLGVLNKKVQNIDDEVALLHELKDIILDFIREIERVDFAENAGIKLLYDKAKGLESELKSRTSMTRLIEVSDNLRKPPHIRIMDVKPFKAIATELYTMNVMAEMEHNSIKSLKNELKHLFRVPAVGNFEFFNTHCPNEYNCDSCGENCEFKCQIIWSVADGVSDSDIKNLSVPCKIIDFQGGLYAVTSGVDYDHDMFDYVEKGIRKWLETSGFEIDYKSGRRRMSMGFDQSDEVRMALGFDQIDVYEPVRIRDNAAELNINPYPNTLREISQAASRIVDLPDENRTNVIEIVRPDSWGVALYKLDRYANKKVTIKFSADVKRIGADGNLNWQINNSDHPVVASVKNTESGAWYSMSGEWTGILTDSYPFIFLSTWENNSDRTTYYITQFEIEVKEVE